jgi:hypothetical protein
MPGYTVGIEPTTFGILAQYIHTGQAWKICLATVGIEPIRPWEYYSPIILCFYVFSSKYFVYKLTTPLMKSNVYVDEASVLKYIFTIRYDVYSRVKNCLAFYLWENVPRVKRRSNELTRVAKCEMCIL